MDNYAPVLITVYDRFNHLKSAVESLKKCAEAINTEIFIASDMTSEKEKEFQISEIRNYINSIKGFKKVTNIFFNENVGIEHSWYFSLDLVFQKYDKIIFLEDDVEVSPLFLNYINKGLDFYKDDPKVFSICGFSPFILGDNYFSENILYKNHEWNAWGFGTWKSKLNTFRNFRKSSEIFLDIKTNLKSILFRSKLNDLSFEYYPHLLNSLKKNKKPEFDYCAGYYCLANNFFNIYPTQSFTINTGNDGSGLRVKKNDEIASKMKPENFSNKILEFKKLSELKINNNYPKYSNNAFVIFIKILAIRLNMFDQAKRIFHIIKY